MTPKTVLVLMSTLAAFALTGCGDNDSASITGPGTTIVDTVPPAVPSGVVAQVLTGSVELTWAENAEPDLAGYVLQRSLDGGVTWQAVGGLLSTAGYSDYKNRTAEYRVAASDLSSNQSAYSSEVGYIIPTPKPKYQQLPAAPRF